MEEDAGAKPEPTAVGPQPGFPKAGTIEEPSEGIQESNVTPPDMGTPQ